MRLVSVGSDLEEVKAHLKNCGYDVLNMENCLRPVEAVIFRGQALAPGLSPAATNRAENTILVNAAGLTPEEVESQLASRLS